MQLSMHVVLFTALSATMAAAMPRAAPVATQSIQPYDPNTDVEAQDRKANAAQVTCKAYLSTGHVQDSVAPCKPYCGNAVDTNAGNISSVTCISGGQGIPTYSDNLGKYNMGVCRCNIGLLDQVVNDVVMALPAIADIGCQILFDAFQTVVEVGLAAIPGGAELDAADAGMQGLVKAGQAVAKAGKKADGLLGWLHPCGESQYTDKVDQVFGDITGNTVGGGGSGNVASDAAAPISSTTSSSSKPAGTTAAPSSTAAAPPKPTGTTTSSAKTSAASTGAAKSSPSNALDVLQAALKTMTSSAAKPKRSVVLSA